MDNLLDSKQLVSGVAILLSFIAGYRYAQRNHENESSKSDTENSNTEKGRVSNINGNFAKKKSNFIIINVNYKFNLIDIPRSWRIQNDLSRSKRFENGKR